MITSFLFKVGVYKTLLLTGVAVPAALAGFVAVTVILSQFQTPQSAEQFSVQTEAKQEVHTTPDALTVDATPVQDLTANFTSESGFSHPGILQSKTQLDFVKTKIAAGEQPWKGEYDKAVTSFYGKLPKTASPVPILKCSTNSEKAASNGYSQVGCTEIVNDSNAAYTEALLWYYSGNPAYASSAKNILNAWAGTMTGILFDQPRYPDGSQVYANGQLYGGWAGVDFLRAAEILRYTYNGWTAADTTLQESHFKTVYYPIMKDGWTSIANRTAIMNETALDIAIFTNDRDMYNYVLPQAKYNIKGLMYQTADGAQPVYPMYKGALNYINTPSELKSVWTNPNSYIDGLEQETCRDLGHTLMGMSSMSNIAEAAGMQGDDIWGLEKKRFADAYELNAGYTLEYLAQTGNKFSTPVPTGWTPRTNWVCPSFTANGGGGASALGWEIAYSALAGRQGVAMPKTEQLLGIIRSGTSSRVGNNMVWETLSNGGNL